MDETIHVVAVASDRANVVVRVCSCKERLFIKMCTDFDQNNYTSQWVVTPIGLVCIYMY